MRVTDILSLSLQSFWQHKVRTVLTLIGVIAGSFLIVVSLAIGEGIKTGVANRLQMGDQLRTIRVRPGQESPEELIPPEELKITGDMSEAKRERIRKAKIAHWNSQNYRPSVPLTAERLDEIAAIPHVVSVVPEISVSCRAILNQKTLFAEFRGADFNDPLLQKVIVEGNADTSQVKTPVLVHEFLAYRLGYKSDAEVRELIGKTITLEKQGKGGILQYAFGSPDPGKNRLTPEESRILDAIVAKFPGMLPSLGLSPEEMKVLQKLFRQKSKTGNHKKGQPSVKSKREKSQKTMLGTFTIIGVYRDPTPDEEQEKGRFFRNSFGLDMILPVQQAREAALESDDDPDTGFYMATVLVDSNENVPEVVQQIEKMKLGQWSLTGILERIQEHIALITWSMAFLAGVALFVAGLGIANTMVMSVMERTHEIGVMKAIGARDLHIQSVFLVEGTLIGLIGGLTGTILGWASSIPGDSMLKNMLKNEFRRLQEESLFAFPPWLVIGVPIFAALVTMIASFYPARRASRINPIEALRHD